MQQMKRLGPIEQLLKLIPGVGTHLKDVDWSAGEKEMSRFEAIVRAMTPKERRSPEIVNGSRRKRIAVGAGVEVSDVNNTLNRFEQMRQLMRGMASGKLPGMGPLGGAPMRTPPHRVVVKKQRK